MMRTQLLARRIAVQSIRQPLTRSFGTTPRRFEGKGPIDAAKDALKSVDRAVSNAAVKGIETGEQAASSAKQAVNEVASSSTADKASGKASELVGEAKGKAAEVSGQAKGKAQEVKGQVKGEVNKL